MTHFVTITSQGQISIPAKVRKLFGLDKIKKLIVYMRDDEIVLKKAPDIDDVAGILHQFAIKDKPIEEVMKMEKEALGEAFAEKYRKKHGL